MNYNQDYSTSDSYFGTQEEAILRQFADRLQPGALVLDIGAGQGRNALYLARLGYRVHALEPSTVAINALKQVAKNEKLVMDLFCDDFEQFDPPVEHYAGIMVFGLLPDLPWTAIHRIVEKIDAWSRTGTLVWITGFTTQDPAYPKHKATWTVLDGNTFQSPAGRVRTYLEPDQILELFAGYSVIHHWEGLGPEHRHGDGPPERHGKFEAVFLKA